jgi:predicted acyl esterase
VTEPFAAETEITGPVVAKLFVSSSATDADLFLGVHFDGRRESCLLLPVIP